MHPNTLAQLEKLKERHPGASLRELPSGAALVSIQSFALPPGWSATETGVHFLLPVGYPGPQPDCFWADSGLRLDGARMPQNCQDQNPIPEAEIMGLWFSWHVVNGWHHVRDSLSTYVSLIKKRFEQLQ